MSMNTQQIALLYLLRQNRAMNFKESLSMNYSERKKEFCIHYNYFINIALQIRKLRLLPAYRLIVNEKYIFRLLYNTFSLQKTILF